MFKQRRIRLYQYSIWAGRLSEGGEYLAQQPGRTDLGSKLSNPEDPVLLRSARLDSDWEAEVLRCLTALRAGGIEFLAPRILGTIGLFDLFKLTPEQEEERWLFFHGQNPAYLGGRCGEVLEQILQRDFRIFYWSFDDASRRLPNFAEGIAPNLSVWVHDEEPIEDRAAGKLRGGCLTYRSSWLANMVPFSFPFRDAPSGKIVFLGSKLGLTGERKRQIDFLARTFLDRFIAVTDHSVDVADRGKFGEYKVHFCPEGRMFTTPSMRLSHTDRPFWAGCLGQVPVVEDSEWGGRMQDLSDQKLIFRYPHGDLKLLKEACESALECPSPDRLAIYRFFNEHGTIGPVIGKCLAEFPV